MPDSTPQHLVALAEANERRVRLASLRRQVSRKPTLAAGCICLAEMLEWHEDALEPGKLLDVLAWPPYMGAQEALYLVRALGVTVHDKRVRDLTERQRTHLAELLRERAWGNRPILTQAA